MIKEHPLLSWFVVATILAFVGVSIALVSEPFLISLALVVSGVILILLIRTVSLWSAPREITCPIWLLFLLWEAVIFVYCVHFAQASFVDDPVIVGFSPPFLLWVLVWMMTCEADFCKKHVLFLVASRFLDRIRVIDSVESVQLATCPACYENPIEDTHYQVCLRCKERYVGEIRRVRSEKYRARKKSLPDTLTVAQWFIILHQFHWKCAYCKVVHFEAMEHITPISKGGGTTADNVVPVCTQCNGSKSGKHPEK